MTLSLATSLSIATPEDAQAIAELKVICWRDAYEGLMPKASLDGLNAADEVPHWRDWLADETAGLVARLLWLDDTLVGYGLAGPMRLGDRPGKEIKADGELYALYIHPDFQHRTFGRTLLAALVDAMMNKGCKSIGVWMIGGHIRAEQFYLKLGAEEVTKRVEIHHGRIAYREKGWIWSDLPKLSARLTIRPV
ncbi:GNAT family N-acetyltransferase [Cohaesibacter marisflavi]|uniref:GNAT family N-acetyltransferase n=1 Tax=Cohaesibacter marisflavi TaxID=655353 RepID=UPI0029C8362C|nr:GNAT family N-acetyltransferase [Cohaesibacter marisflavi]